MGHADPVVVILSFRPDGDSLEIDNMLVPDQQSEEDGDDTAMLQLLALDKPLVHVPVTLSLDAVILPGGT